MTSSKGYSVWSAAVFITSFMAGMGVLAMPHALAGTGWCGLILIALACVNAWYSSLILGRSWLIMEERWVEYREKCRYPYPAIGEKAVGPWMRFAAVGALATACLACVSIFVSMILQIPDMKNVQYGGASFSSASLAFGTILFAYSGVYMFPTIQNDMRNRQQFKKATIISFIGILMVYLPVIITGYAVLGSAVPVNILMAIEKGYFRSFIEACLALHIFLAFLLAINPVAQEIEEAFRVKSSFNYKRCIIRTVIVALILTIAYTIPHFDKILNLIGGSTMTLLSFILPPLFYLLLVKKGVTETKREISAFEKIFLYEIMITGCIGAITCTYFAVADIIDVFVQDKESGSKGDHGIPI